MIGVIILHDRPQYLKRIIESLESNTIQLNWIFLQDGPKTKRTETCQNIIKQSKLKGEIYQPAKNISPLGQYLKALSFSREFERLFIFEDDMIISSYYIELMKRISHQFPNSVIFGPDYPNKPNPTRELLNKLDTQPYNLWGFLLPSHIALKVKPHIEEYRDFLFQKVKTSDSSTALFKRPNKLIRERYNVRVTGVDAILHKAIKEESDGVINTVLPRGRYIGKFGIQQRANQYEQRFGKFQEYEFEEDKYLDQFEII